VITIYARVRKSRPKTTLIFWDERARDHLFTMRHESSTQFANGYDLHGENLPEIQGFCHSRHQVRAALELVFPARLEEKVQPYGCSKTINKNLCEVLRHTLGDSRIKTPIREVVFDEHFWGSCFRSEMIFAAIVCGSK